MYGIRSIDQASQPGTPHWVSDTESKDYLRSRKLGGYWTITIDVRMLAKDVFSRNDPVYDDGSHFSQLAFFRISDDYGALEWDSARLECRIWILVRDISESEIADRVRSLRDILSSYLDFRNAKLTLEAEPNELTLAETDPKRLVDLRETVTNAERRLNSLSYGAG
jgi:hypothetical protein